MAPPQQSDDFASVSNKPTEWVVTVRHSPFLLKGATVEAASPDEAKRRFLELTKQRSEEKAGKQRGPERDKDAQRVRDSHAEALNRQRDLEWTVRPAAEVKAELDAIKAAQTGAATRFDAAVQVLATAAKQ